MIRRFCCNNISDITKNIFQLNYISKEMKILILIFIFALCFNQTTLSEDPLGFETLNEQNSLELNLPTFKFLACTIPCNVPCDKQARLCQEHYDTCRVSCVNYCDVKWLGKANDSSQKTICRNDCYYQSNCNQYNGFHCPSLMCFAECTKKCISQ
jgi:hypothetical protein